MNRAASLLRVSGSFHAHIIGDHLNKDITTEGTSVFDSYIETVSRKPKTFAVLLEGRPTLVFRRTTDWDEMQSIRQRAINQTKAASEGNVHSAWKEFLSVDPTVAGRAVHLSSRHVGVLIDGELVQEKWEDLHFIKLAKLDPHGFNALMESVNNEVAVGWTVEDRDYFREASCKTQEEPDGDDSTAGSTPDMAPAP